MRERLLVPTPVEVEEAALQLDPGIRAHLLGRDLVLGLEVECVRGAGGAGMRAPVGEAGQTVPRPDVLDHRFVGLARRRVIPLLQRNLGGQCSDSGAIGQFGDRGQVGPSALEAVHLEIEVGAQQDQLR